MKILEFISIKYPLFYLAMLFFFIAGYLKEHKIGMRTYVVSEPI